MAFPITLGSEHYGGDIGRWRRRDGWRKKWRLRYWKRAWHCQYQGQGGEWRDCPGGGHSCCSIQPGSCKGPEMPEAGYLGGGGCSWRGQHTGGVRQLGLHLGGKGVHRSSNRGRPGTPKNSRTSQKVPGGGTGS
jgi:hypothetical protein